ncbi:MAG: response regulator [Myxococcales bacterium]|nr:response regulator [Myxococcales bacterium]MCB9705660.1 response regulator [Myxococcales bacterium]
MDRRREGATMMRRDVVAEPSLPAAQRRPLILVVDDNAANREIMVGQLKVLGFDAEEAATGELALRCLAERRFDAVLMDCHMPLLDGYATTRRLRTIEGERHHTVVIAVTAHGLHGERQRCLAAGMDDYLPKPFRVSELGLMLRRWVEGAEAPRPAVAAAPSAPAPPSSTELDSRSIEGLRRLGVLRRVIDLVSDALPPQLVALQAAVEHDEWSRVREIAHNLRGVTAQIGARDFARLCEVMEAAAERQASSRTSVALRELQVASVPLLEAMRALRT